MRHKASIHSEFVEESNKDKKDDTDSDESSEEGSDISSGDDNNDDNRSENEADSEESNDETDVENEDENEDNEDEEDEDDEEETYDLWTYLKTVASRDGDIETQFEEVKGRLDDGELSDDEVVEQAKRVIRPEILKHIYEHYANFLKIWHFAKEDPYHKRIMQTKRKLMDEEDFSPVEAIEQAVKKRKYLIVKATNMLEADLVTKVPAPVLPEEGVEEEEEET